MELDIKRIKRELEELHPTALETMAYLEHLNKSHKETLIKFEREYPILGCIKVKDFITQSD